MVGSGIKFEGILLFCIDDIFKWDDFLKELKKQMVSNEPSPGKRIRKMCEKYQEICDQNIKWNEEQEPDEQLKSTIVDLLNYILESKDFYDEKSFKIIKQCDQSKELINKGMENLTDYEAVVLNRLIIEDSYPEMVMKYQDMYKGLISSGCIEIIENLHYDLDIIKLYEDENGSIYTNIILYLPHFESKKKLRDCICKKVLIFLKLIHSKRSKKGESSRIKLLPFILHGSSRCEAELVTPTPGTTHPNDNCGLVEIILNLQKNNKFIDYRPIEKIGPGDKVIVLASNYIIEINEIVKRIENKKAELICILFILGLSKIVREKIKIKYEIQEIISIDDISKRKDCTELFSPNSEIRKEFEKYME